MYAGLGNPKAKFNVFLENSLPLSPYSTASEVIPVSPGELSAIGQQTSNHWRKVFNVYAKLLQALYPEEIIRWQDYRDDTMLGITSNQSLIYSPVNFQSLPQDSINIIMGKTYATKQGIASHCYWDTPDFAVNKSKQIIICPYFDYRQLTNEKIKRLAYYIQLITNGNIAPLYYCCSDI